MALLPKLVLVFTVAVTVLFNGLATEAKTPVEAFARMPLFSGVSISPDGKYMAVKHNREGRYTFLVFEIAGKKLKNTYAANLGKYEARWTRWASNTRFLVSIGWATNRGGTPVTETRLLAMNFDGSRAKDMIQSARGFYDLQIQDRVVSFLPNDPDYIIMSYSDTDPRRPKPHRVDINTGKGRTIGTGSRPDITDWMSDRTGQVRLGLGRTKEGIYIVDASDSNGDNWQRIHSATVASGKNFFPVGFSPDPDILFVLSNHGSGRNALYEYRISAQQFGRLLHSDPEVDVESVWINETTGRLRRATTYLNGAKHKWFDPISEVMYKKLNNTFPGKYVSVREVSPDDKIWVSYVTSDTDPGQFVIFDRQSNSAISLGANYPELKGVRLSPMRPFNYRARDGLEIPAYLTLPPSVQSVETANRLPMVVMPHGGPAARDYLSFDPVVQFLANRGYAVLQMNFRGSGGYGAQFEVAGYGEWGGKMQDDVTDGAKYMIEQGIADPQRICIFGGSYGGYAALMGAVKTPDLYQCAVGWNGAYDLKKLMRDDLRYVNRGRVGYWETSIGDFSNTEFLESISPANRAGEIRIPILLTAAKDDRVVRSSQTDVMASALRRAKVTYDYIEVDNGGHGYRSTESRLEFMKALDDFLDEHLKP